MARQRSVQVIDKYHELEDDIVKAMALGFQGEAVDGLNGLVAKYPKLAERASLQAIREETEKDLDMIDAGPAYQGPGSVFPSSEPEEERWPNRVPQEAIALISFYEGDGCTEVAYYTTRGSHRWACSNHGPR